MTEPTNWWICFSVSRYMSDGVATRLAGPCGAHPANCRVSAQRLFGDWMESETCFPSNNAHPTTDLELPEGLRLYEQLAKVHMQLVSPAVMGGIDGETYTLEFGCGFNTVKLQWFIELPLEWQALQPITSKMEELGEQCLAPSA